MKQTYIPIAQLRSDIELVAKRMNVDPVICLKMARTNKQGAAACYRAIANSYRIPSWLV